jgi:hypothetical protein
MLDGPSTVRGGIGVQRSEAWIADGILRKGTWGSGSHKRVEEVLHCRGVTNEKQPCGARRNSGRLAGWLALSGRSAKYARLEFLAETETARGANRGGGARRAAVAGHACSAPLSNLESCAFSASVSCLRPVLAL